jgi:hypothetical protein
MRCFLMTGGHIESVRILPDHLSDQDAVKHCQRTFEMAAGMFDAFEVWHLERMVHQHSAAGADSSAPEISEPSRAAG